MFSDRVRYKINVLVHLALNDDRDYQTTSEIADEVATVPDAYLNKITGELSKLGYLETKKGPSGGVRLRDEPDQIFMSQFLNDVRALDHADSDADCCGPGYADRCIMEHWINGFQKDVVGKSTLQDVAEFAQG